MLRSYPVLEAPKRVLAIAGRYLTGRVDKAVSLLPDAMDAHRLDAALALDYLHWAS